jgi:hypothetical protein
MGHGSLLQLECDRALALQPIFQIGREREMIPYCQEILRYLAETSSASSTGEIASDPAK